MDEYEQEYELGLFKNLYKQSSEIYLGKEVVTQDTINSLLVPPGFTRF